MACFPGPLVTHALALLLALALAGCSSSTADPETTDRAAEAGDGQGRGEGPTASPPVAAESAGPADLGDRRGAEPADQEKPVPQGARNGQEKPQASVLPQPAGPRRAEDATLASLRRSGAKHLARGHRASWSGDGRRVVFGKMPYGTGLQVLDLATGKISDLAAPGKDPAWCPKEPGPIAYVRGDGGQEEIWLVEANGGNSRKLSPGGFPSWSADGRTLSYYSRTEETIVAWRPDSPDVPAAPVFPAKSIRYPYCALSGDGKRVALAGGKGVQVRDCPSGKVSWEWDATGWWGMFGGWSPGGDYLAFGSFGEGNDAGLWVLHLPSGHAGLVLPGSCTMPVWSPDGSRVVVDVRRDSGRGIWLIDAARLRSVVPPAPERLAPDEQRGLQSELGRLDSLARDLERKGDLVQTIEIRESALATHRRLWGYAHPQVVDGLAALSGLYERSGQPSLAVARRRETLEVAAAVYGAAAPQTHAARAAWDKIRDRLRDRERLRQEAAGLDRQQKYSEAVLQWEAVLALDRDLYGERAAEYADSLSSAAQDYRHQRDFAKAELLSVQACVIRKEVHGEEDLRYADSLEDLASIYAVQRRYAKAEWCNLQAMEVRKKAQGEDPHGYAKSLHRLAVSYQDQGKHVQAERLYLEAIDILKRYEGEKGLGVASALNNLANLYHNQGHYAKAESFYLQAMRIREERRDERYPLTYAESLRDLAEFYCDRKEYAKAEPLARKAFQISTEFATAVLAFQPESRALGFGDEVGSRKRDEALLDVLRALKKADELDAYRAVWQSRGAATYELLERRRHAVDSPKGQALRRELQATAQELAQLTLAAPEPGQGDARRKRLTELSDRKERIEVELARVSQEFRGSRQLAGAQVEDLMKLLPKDAAVVHVIQTKARQRPVGNQGRGRFLAHYDAFVVRGAPAPGGSPITWALLGPASPINEAVSEWRAAIAGDPRGSSRPVDESDQDEPVGSGSPPHRLRRLVWRKLEPHLSGCSTVILIPEGELCFLPWPALPGRKPGTFLLEDYALAVAPSARQLHALLAQAASPSGGLLVVGGVDYDARPSPAGGRAPPPNEPPSAPAVKTRLHWGPLPGTAAEATEIETLWSREPKPVVLRGAAAGEPALRDSLPRSRSIHLATHGFFADAEFRSRLGHTEGDDRLFGRSADLVSARSATASARNPLVLSGVVLAGANQAPPIDRQGLPMGDDGILTAEEIAGLDLRGTELVVLSACDTGLGRVAGGEGVMGLQRAFHLAGARSVIASLWKVDDAATRVLMVEFYTNVWKKRLGKLESLRQAQLAMLRGYDPATNRLVRGEGPRRPVDAARLPPAKAIETKRTGALPASYWAAFVLSGDWR